MDKVIHSKEIAQERVEWGKRYTYFKKNLLLVEESFLQCEEESLVEEVCPPSSSPQCKSTFKLQLGWISMGERVAKHGEKLYLKNQEL